VNRPYLWQHNRRAELVFISPHLLIGALLVCCAKAVCLVMQTAPTDWRFDTKRQKDAGVFLHRKKMTVCYSKPYASDF
jgi:hypothetical protein